MNVHGLVPELPNYIDDDHLIDAHYGIRPEHVCDVLRGWGNIAIPAKVPEMCEEGPSSVGDNRVSQLQALSGTGPLRLFTVVEEDGNHFTVHSSVTSVDAQTRRVFEIAEGLTEMDGIETLVQDTPHGSRMATPLCVGLYPADGVEVDPEAIAAAIDEALYEERKCVLVLCGSGHKLTLAWPGHTHSLFDMEHRVAPLLYTLGMRFGVFLKLKTGKGLRLYGPKRLSVLRTIGEPCADPSFFGWGASPMGRAIVACPPLMESLGQNTPDHECVATCLDVVNGLNPRRATSLVHALEVGCLLFHATGGSVYGWAVWAAFLNFHRQCRRRPDLLHALYIQLGSRPQAATLVDLRIVFGDHILNDHALKQWAEVARVAFGHGNPHALGVAWLRSLCEYDSPSRHFWCSLREAARRNCPDLSTLPSLKAFEAQIERTDNMAHLISNPGRKWEGGRGAAVIAVIFGVVPTETSIVNLIQAFMGHRVMATDHASSENEVFLYDRNIHRWVKCGNMRAVKVLIEEYLREVLQACSLFSNPVSALDAIEGMAERAGGGRPKAGPNPRKAVERFLATDQMLGGLAKGLYRRCVDHGSVRGLLNLLPNIPFKNGVLSLTEMRFRDGLPFDLCLSGPLFALRPLKASSPEVLMYERHMMAMSGCYLDVFEDLGRLLALFLEPMNRHKLFIFLHGPSNGGKSTFTEILGLALGSLISHLPVAHFCSQRDEGASAHTQALLDAQGSRVAVIPEMGKRDRIKKRAFKVSCGNDRQPIRGLFKGFTFEVFSFMPMAIVNDLPEIDGGVDEACARRLFLLPLGVRFSRNAPKCLTDQIRLNTFRIRHFSNADKQDLAESMVHHAYTTYSHYGMGSDEYQFERSRRSKLDALKYAGHVTRLRTFLQAFLSPTSLLGPVPATLDRALELLSHRIQGSIRFRIRRQAMLERSIASDDVDFECAYFVALAANRALHELFRLAGLARHLPRGDGLVDLLWHIFPSHAGAIARAVGRQAPMPTEARGFGSVGRAIITTAFGIFLNLYHTGTEGLDEGQRRTRRRRDASDSQMETDTEPTSDRMSVSVLGSVDAFRLDMEPTMITRTLAQETHRTFVSNDSLLPALAFVPPSEDDSERSRVTALYLKTERKDEVALNEAMDAACWLYTQRHGFPPLHHTAMDSADIRRYMSATERAALGSLGGTPLHTLDRVLMSIAAGQPPRLAQSPQAFDFLKEVAHQCWTDALADCGIDPRPERTCIFSDWEESADTERVARTAVATDWDEAYKRFLHIDATRSMEEDSINAAQKVATMPTGLSRIGQRPLVVNRSFQGMQLLAKKKRQRGAWAAPLTDPALSFRIAKCMASPTNRTIDLCDSDDDDEGVLVVGGGKE